MRTLHVIASVILSVVIFGLAGCQDAGKADTAEQFVNRVMDTAIRNWDADALYAMSSEEFKGVATEDAVREMFRHYTVLGSLKSFGPPEGQVRQESLPDGTSAEVGAYHVAAEFDKDKVSVGIVAIRTGNGWALYGIRINSNYVMSIMQAAKSGLQETHAPADDTVVKEHAPD